MIAAAIVLGASDAAVAAGCPNDAVRDRTERALPECRAYEQVSPPDKNANDVGQTFATTPVFIASADGSRFAFETLGTLPGGASATTVNVNVSRRGEGGWTTQPVSPPQAPRPNIDFPYFQYFTPNVDVAVVRTPSGPSLAPGDTPGAANFYLRDNATGRYETLSVGAPSGQVPPSNISYTFAGASDDLRHIVFESNDALTPEAPVSVAAAFKRNLYEWVDGSLRLVTVLPDGTAAPEGGTIGAAALTEVIDHAISADGRRIAFLTDNASPDGSQLYVREDGLRTFEASASQRSSPDPTPSPPRFWGATADGASVFFTSDTALTDDAAIGARNLYRFDVETQTLHNLTAGSLGTPFVQGVLGITDDGATIYFRDTSLYEAGRGVDGLSNVYRWHDGSVRLVVTDDPGEPVGADVMRSRMTSDGRFLVFPSANPLTGYDSTDAITGAQDNQVFLYDAQVSALRCVSCNPSGARPFGPSTIPSPPVRAERNLQRSVSDDGRRVFFDSADALVPQDVNGKLDVYEYADGVVHLISSGRSGDDSAFAGASRNGDDVFLVTRERLAATDEDDNLDVYDARVNGGFAEPAHVEPCSGDACQGTSTPPPVPPAPASPLVTGKGNLAEEAPRAATFRLTPASAADRRRAARTGVLTLQMQVSNGGILQARASRLVRGRARTVATAKAYPLRAGRVQLRLRLPKSVRSALADGRKVRLSVRVTFSHVRASKTTALELHR